MNIAKRMQDDVSHAIDDMASAMLDMDIKQMGIDIHYTDQDIMNATHIFNHVLSNRMIHNMIRDRITQNGGESKAEEMGNKLKNFIIEMTGFDPSKFYPRDNHEKILQETSESDPK